MPIARVVYPDEYVIQTHQIQRSGGKDSDVTDQWPAIDRLFERIGPFPYGYQGLTDEKLVHCFDREMEAAGNPHLVRPVSTDFRPWSEYTLAVPDGQGNEITRSTVEHYYSYWQAHQLCLIQQYPDLYKNARLIECIPNDDPARTFLPRAPKKEHLAEFNGMQRNFDALSFWVTLYIRERNRTFASVSEIDGVRRLNNIQATAHQKRLASFAGNVSKRFQFTPEDLYGFLHQLIELMEEYERRERYKLAEVLRSDIFAWEKLLTLTTGDTRNEVADELGEKNIYNKRTFRHLDVATKQRDYTLELLNSVSEESGRALQRLGVSHWSFTAADANDLLNYCEQAGLDVFVSALSGMVAIGDEEYRQKFTRVQKYTNLKNVLTSYEYLLRAIARGAGLTVGGETLTPLVDKVMRQASWWKLFNAKKGFKANNSQDFLAKLRAFLTDIQLKGSTQGYWAQKFLVMCLARNMTIHSYPNEDEYYGDLFGTMLDAAIVATFYTWSYAKAKGWT